MQFSNIQPWQTLRPRIECLSSKFGAFALIPRGTLLRKTGDKHHAYEVKLVFTVQFSKIQPWQTLQSRIECLSSKFSAVSSIPRGTLLRKTGGKQHAYEVKLFLQCSFQKSGLGKPSGLG